MHLTSSSSTILLKGTDIKLYLESLVGEGEGSGVKVVDFAELVGEKKGKEAAA